MYEDDIDYMYEKYMESLIEEQELEQQLNAESARCAARSRMWSELIPGYMNLDNKKSAKNAFAKQRGLKPHQITPDNYKDYMIQDYCDINPVALGSCVTTPTVLDYPPGFFSTGSTYTHVSNFTTTEGANPMCYNNTTTAYSADQARVKYLKERVSEIVSDKRSDVHDFFLGQDLPKTVKELKERMAAGKYLIDSDDNIKIYEYDSPGHFITFRDKPIDRDGYDAAVEEIEKARISATDQIMVGDAATALKAVQDFEARTFH